MLLRRNFELHILLPVLFRRRVAEGSALFKFCIEAFDLFRTEVVGGQLEENFIGVIE